MSEQQNVALIQSIYDAFGRGDIQYIMDRLADDVEWKLEAPASISYAGHRRGKKEVMGFFEGIGTSETNQKLTIDHLFGQGDMVAGFGRYAGVVKSTGKSFDTAIAHYFRVRDGKVVEFVDYIDTAASADARAATSAAGR
jgi:uncharacterized protein